MTVNTEMPVFETTGPRATAGDAADTQELLHTMAAVVRTVFGVALQAPADAAAVDQPAAQAEPAQLAPVAISLPPEAPTSIAVDFPPAPPAPPAAPAPVEAQQPEHVEQQVGLSVAPVPAPEPEAATSIPMPSISLGDTPWSPPPAPPVAETAPAPAPAYTPVEPTIALAMPEDYQAAIAVPAYAAPVLPEPAATDRHSMALLQEIAFLDD